MARTKISELSCKYGVDSRDIIAFLNENGIEAMSSQKTLDDDVVAIIDAQFGGASAETVESNFDFLKERFPDLAEYGRLAEKNIYDDPTTSLSKIGKIGVYVVDYIYSQTGLADLDDDSDDDSQYRRIKALKKKKLIPSKQLRELDAFRWHRNGAEHMDLGNKYMVLAMLEYSHDLCEWFMQTYGDSNYAHHDYVEPVDPSIRQREVLGSGAMTTDQTTSSKTDAKDQPSYNAAITNWSFEALLGSSMAHDTENSTDADELYWEADELWDSECFDVAVILLEDAASQGSRLANDRLGNLYRLGDHVERDYLKALKYYKAAAEMGSSSAALQVGDIYNYGDGVGIDYASARYWYERAALGGDIDAYSELGLMYYLGNGVEENDGTALQFFRVAAEKGDAQASYYIGDIYYYGRGVSIDYAEAKKWLLRAAQGGNKDAIKMLASIGE